MKKKVKEEDKKGLYLTQSHAKAIAAIGDDAATATVRANTQIMLAIEEILEDDFGFSKEDIKRFGGKLKWMLSTLYNLKKDSLTVMNHRDMQIVGEIARRWALGEYENKTGLELPEELTKKLIKH